MNQWTQPRWLLWAREIQALAQTGLAFTRDQFDRERYQRLLALAAQMMARHTGLEVFSLLNRTSWVVAAATWFLGMWFDLLTFAMPMGLGTLEGSRIIALRAVGHGALLGMTYGVALRLAQLFWAMAGLVNYAFLASEKTLTNSRNER